MKPQFSLPQKLFFCASSILLTVGLIVSVDITVFTLAMSLLFVGINLFIWLEPSHVEKFKQKFSHKKPYQEVELEKKQNTEETFEFFGRAITEHEKEK